MMKEKYFDLDPHDQLPAVKILQIIFGILCITATVYYILTGLISSTSNTTLWVAVVFLVFFGIYQILSGLGKTKKYFRLTQKNLTFKQHSVLPAIDIPADKIDKIELFPLSIKFILKTTRKIKFRFGISYPEIIDPVKQEVISFAENHGISWIEVPEEI